MWPRGMFGKLFGEKRTSLPIGPAVTYQYTLHWPSVAEHTSHPIHNPGSTFDVQRSTFNVRCSTFNVRCSSVLPGKNAYFQIPFGQLRRHFRTAHPFGYRLVKCIATRCPHKHRGTFQEAVLGNTDMIHNRTICRK